jgi:UDP:flavonoid glycosyltransferase YjiC (YdhE family)
VVLRTLAGEVEAMRSRGFEAAPIARQVEALAMEDWRARTATGAQVKALRTIRARAPHDSRDLLQALESARPEALIVDVLAAGALTAAASWDGPWSCYRPFPVPPSRVALKLLGIAGPLAAAPLHLYMSAEPFEYPRPHRPESVVMVGPCTWEPPGELPAKLAEIDEPLVLVTTSTEFQDDSGLVRTAFEALAEEPLHVVATLPSADQSDIEAPANATLLGFAPHSPILARAACAITHGGMGATQKALANGVPVCAVPFGRDQPEVARRVEAAAAGARLPARRLNPRRLRAKAGEAIACRAGAERIARAFDRAGGAPAAADAVECRLLGS